MKEIHHLSDKFRTTLFVRQTEPFFALPVQLLGANTVSHRRDAHGFHDFIVQCRFI